MYVLVHVCFFFFPFAYIVVGCVGGLACFSLVFEPGSLLGNIHSMLHMWVTCVGYARVFIFSVCVFFFSVCVFFFSPFTYIFVGCAGVLTCLFFAFGAGSLEESLFGNIHCMWI